MASLNFTTVSINGNQFKPFIPAPSSEKIANFSSSNENCLDSVWSVLALSDYHTYCTCLKSFQIEILI